MLKAKKLALILISMILVVLTACSKEDKTEQVTGKSLYEKNCMSCHGEMGSTGLSLSLKDKIKNKSVEDLEKTILTPPAGMPKILEDEDAHKVAKWLQEQNK
ncbi:c-type cytochrome [Cytobacillus sp. Hz8]|uniref:c-type cytochrome n=1 Tax=Cytobacillus sp. Hz8 TaxID=3347168 RepID=UPI0035E0F682